METVRNIQKISLIFFIIVGSIHILSGLMLQQETAIKFANAMNRVLDMPFIIVALTYGGSSVYLQCASQEKNNTALKIVLLSIATLLILIALYINFFIPDV